MWSRIFTEATPLEIAQILAIMAGIGLCLMFPLVGIFGRILALKKRPERRALLTTLAAYIGVALAFVVFGGEFIAPLFAPLVPLPGAVLIYLWLRYSYRSGWIEDDAIPEGTRLANSDWVVGLIAVIGVLGIAAIKLAIFR